MIGAASIGSNQTEISLGSGTRILVSYKTPVAAYVRGRGYIRTEGWSRTTSRHINSWMGKGGEVVDRSDLEALLSGSAATPKNLTKPSPDKIRVIKLRGE